MSLWARLKSTIKYLTPPVLIDLTRSLGNLIHLWIIEWEYMPDGWATERTNPKIKGWNVESVLEAYKSRWTAFVKNLEGTAPFGASPESLTFRQIDLVFHNTIMSYAYAFTLASRYRSSISMLDWGGGIGHYYLISKTLVPDLKIEYHCKDVPVLAEHGQTLFPEAYFYADETCLARQYDFVLVSTSLHYSQDWRSLLERLARATDGYLFVTQLPIVHQISSFVFVQRPYQYGYNTEYLGWCLNHDEFLKYAETAGLELMRQFVTGQQPVIHRAREQCQYYGFLFRPFSKK
jgi:putative methyltransferase (TIGR04325 family)